MRNGSAIGSTSVFDQGTINLFDGYVDDDLRVYGSGTANIYADAVIGEYLKVYELATVNVFGGTMEGLSADSRPVTNSSVVNVSDRGHPL